MRPRVGYLHVPKTAGSAVTRAIGEHVPPWKVCPVRLDTVLFGAFDRFEEMAPSVAHTVHSGPASALAGYDVVMGHLALSTLLACMEASDIALLVREPRSRVLSHYAYWHGWPEQMHDLLAPYDASRRAAAMDFEEFLGDPGLACQADNLVLRMLLHPHPAIPRDGFIAAGDLPGLAEEAARRMADVGFLGAVESGATGWDRLGRWLGVRLDVTAYNVTRGVARAAGAADRLPESLLRLWDNRTVGDRQLWEIALRTGGVDVDTAAALAEASLLAQVSRFSGLLPAARPGAGPEGRGQPGPGPHLL